MASDLLINKQVRAAVVHRLALLDLFNVALELLFCVHVLGVVFSASLALVPIRHL